MGLTPSKTSPMPKLPFYKQVFTCKEKFCNNQFIPHWEMNDSDSKWVPGRLYCSVECEVWDRELGNGRQG